MQIKKRYNHLRHLYKPNLLIKFAMFTGHYAIGLALKERYPKIPVYPVLLGIGFIDILAGIFIMIGIDKVKPDLASGPYLFFDMPYVDTDHSLLMSLVWSAVWGLCIFKKNYKFALIAAFAVFSHFLADLLVHNPDLALYPHAAYHLGFGLWAKLGTASWVLEGVFSALLIAYAWRRSSIRGVSLLGPVLLLVVLFITMSPWLSPMLAVARMQEPGMHILHGAMVAAGFLIPALIIS